MRACPIHNDFLYSVLRHSKSIPLKDISRIYLISHIIQASIIAVGDDGLALGFELIEVVDDLRAKERFAIGNGWLIDDDFCTFGLDALHNALDSTLAEVIAVRLHSEAIDTNDTHKRCMMDEV